MYKLYRFTCLSFCGWPSRQKLVVDCLVGRIDYVSDANILAATLLSSSRFRSFCPYLSMYVCIFVCNLLLEFIAAANPRITSLTATSLITGTLYGCTLMCLPVVIFPTVVEWIVIFDDRRMRRSWRQLSHLPACHFIPVGSVMVIM